MIQKKASESLLMILKLIGILRNVCVSKCIIIFCKLQLVEIKLTPSTE